MYDLDLNKFDGSQICLNGYDLDVENVESLLDFYIVTEIELYENVVVLCKYHNDFYMGLHSERDEVATFEQITENTFDSLIKDIVRNDNVDTV